MVVPLLLGLHLRTVVGSVVMAIHPDALLRKHARPPNLIGAMPSGGRASEGANLAELIIRTDALRKIAQR